MLNALRDQVVKALAWHDAHVDFERAVAATPVEVRGRKPQGLPYSPWQLLYLNDAVELPRISVPIEWLLDDERRATLGPTWRTVLSRQLEDWRQLDRAWRDVLLVLIRLQGWYGPSVNGTLLKSTVTLVPHPESGEYVFPHGLATVGMGRPSLAGSRDWRASGHRPNRRQVARPPRPWRRQPRDWPRWQWPGR